MWYFFHQFQSKHKKSKNKKKEKKKKKRYSDSEDDSSSEEEDNIPTDKELIQKYVVLQWTRTLTCGSFEKYVLPYKVRSSERL